MVNIDSIIKKIELLFAGDFSGHDFRHSIRVYRNACLIAESEECDKDVVSLAALLHDADDVKLFHTENYANAKWIMTEEGIDADIQERVIDAISTVSFKGTDTKTPSSIEGKIVQDADRLDAIGAIGIARAFAFGGSRGREMYNPEEKPAVNMSEEEYRSSEGTTINHFYEKLFLLKNMMNTKTAQRLAEKRDAFMHEFVDEFLEEWNGLENQK
ncbi:MAG TPA: HD domain-containing protein [Methanocorpusculum sp.]|nr:HD domain-containing protein [Methanocorpusculum sp.]